MATIDSLINLENLDDIINSNDLDKIDLSKFYQEIYGSNNIEENTEKKCLKISGQLLKYPTITKNKVLIKP